MNSLAGFVLGVFISQITFLNAQTLPIAVLDFDGFGISETEAVALSNRLRNELFRMGAFEVVDRGMMENILAEQDFQMTGCTSNDCLVQVGQLLGAQQMVGGSISKVGGTFTVSARLVDVETGKVIGVSDFDLRGELDDMLTRGMRQVAIMLSGTEVSAPAGARAETEPTPAVQVPARSPVTDVGQTSLPWQAVVGIPVKEVGYTMELAKVIGRGWPLGVVLIKPAISLGYMFRSVEDGDAYYDDERGYLSVTARADLKSQKLSTNFFSGLGLSVGGYYEEVSGYEWSSDEMETVFILGAQVSIPVASSFQVVGDARIVNTEMYGASFLFQVGLQR
jgi:TolB-like protein